MARQGRSRGLRELCKLLGYTSQAYYQYRKAAAKRGLEEDLVIQQVLHHRRLQPRLGTRKLQQVMQPFMESHRIEIGRDLLFDVLRANGLLVRSRRRTQPRTTFSAHLFKKYPDLIKGLLLTRSGALWVSDITYIRLFRDEFAYLSLVIDAYSRKIVGFHLSESLSADSCILALQMALADQAPAKDSLIHHSDRGAQYCSHLYTGLLLSQHIGISMTQSGDPRDNAIAERVNGILKHELLQDIYPDMRSASRDVEKAIDIYNRLRPHSSVNMLTPEQAHRQNGEIRRRWKNYYKTTARELAEV